MPKKKLVQVLEMIYYGTHPSVTAPQDEERGKQTKKRNKKAATTTKAATTGLTSGQVPTAIRVAIPPVDLTCRQVDKRTKNPPKSKKSATTTTHVQVHAAGKRKRQLTETDKSFKCQPKKSSSLSNTERNLVETSAHDTSIESTDCCSADDSDHSDVPEESMMYSPVKMMGRAGDTVHDEQTTHQRLWDYVSTNERLYRSILHYEPLELDEFMGQLKVAGMKLVSKDVIEFLDEQNILFTTRKSQCGWAARRAGKVSKRSRKAASHSRPSASGSQSLASQASALSD
jgi:hypothetical protein